MPTRVPVDQKAIGVNGEPRRTTVVHPHFSCLFRVTSRPVLPRLTKRISSELVASRCGSHLSGSRRASPRARSAKGVSTSQKLHNNPKRSASQVSSTRGQPRPQGQARVVETVMRSKSRRKKSVVDPRRLLELSFMNWRMLQIALLSEGLEESSKERRMDVGQRKLALAHP